MDNVMALIHKHKLLVGEAEELVEFATLEEVADGEGTAFILSRDPVDILEALYYSDDKGRWELVGIIEDLLYNWDTSTGENTLADIIMNRHEDVLILTVDPENPLYVLRKEVYQWN